MDEVAGSGGGAALDPADDASAWPTLEVRRTMAWIATAGAVWCAIAVLLALAPQHPVADIGFMVVAPALVAVFPVWAVTVVAALAEMRSSTAEPHIGMPLPLRGWRVLAGSLVFAFGGALALGMVLSGNLGGQPVEEDGRYYSDSHGERTELTRDEYEAEQASSIVFFAAGGFVFNALGALYLSQPPGDRAPRPSAGLVPSDPTRPAGWSEALADVVVPGDPQTVLDRLTRAAPLEGVGHASAGRIDAVAAWPFPPGALVGYPLEVEANLTAHGMRETAVALRVAPRPARLKRDVVNGVLTLVLAPVGLAFIGRGELPVALLALFYVFLVLVTTFNVTMGRRAARRASRQLVTAAGAQLDGR